MVPNYNGLISAHLLVTTTVKAAYHTERILIKNTFDSMVNNDTIIIIFWFSSTRTLI